MTTETTSPATAAEEQEALDQLIQITRGRSATYGFLARLYRLEVDEEMLETLKAMPFPTRTGNADADEGNRLICSYLSNCNSRAITELAVDYVRTFIGAGNDGFSAAYPFESVYTSPKRLMMQDARDEVLVIYRAFGMDKRESWKEGEDHISCEFEFLQVLCERTAEALEAGDEDEALRLLTAQSNFLKDHVAAWFPMMYVDMQKFPRTDFYRGLGKLTSGFLANERQLLDELLEESEQEEQAA